MDIEHEIRALAAENMALQFVLICLMQRVGESSPALRAPILQAFDDAANHAENASIVRGSQAGHLPETLRIIEKLREILVGHNKPRGLV